jgi:hypothetical protein
MRRCVHCGPLPATSFSPRSRNLCRACKAKQNARRGDLQKLSVNDAEMQAQKLALHDWAKTAQRPVGRF